MTLPIAVNQTDWHIDRVNGKKTGTGSAIDPVDSAATIRARWTANVPGARPELPAITITITCIGPGINNDFSDPLSVLWDVDGQGTQIIIKGDTTLAPQHSSVFNTVSVFARTAADGQVQITDLGVGDYAPFINSLILDTQKDAVAALYEPNGGASATGIIARAAAAQVPGAFFTPVAVDLTAGDAYQILTLTKVYLGSGGIARSFPNIKTDGSSNPMRVFLYRLGFQKSAATEIADLRCSNSAFIFQECVIDPTATVTSGASVFFINCLHTSGGLGAVRASGGGSVGFISGYAFLPGGASLGGIIECFNDFATKGAYTCTFGGQLILINCSGWVPQFGVSPVDLTYGRIQAFSGLVQVPSGVVYGTVGAPHPIASVAVGFNNTGASIVYGGASASATFLFDGPQTVRFGFATNEPSAYNLSTGAWTLPFGSNYSPTLAQIDAPITPGPGFGGRVVDPLRGGLFTVSN